MILLNTLPVVALTALLYGLFGRAWVAFLAGGGVALGLSLGNYYKLVFRDDPLYFEDFQVLAEAATMTTSQRYALFVDTRIVLCIALLAAGTLVLARRVPGKLPSWRRRSAVALGAAALALLVWHASQDDELYDSIENYDYLQQWSATQSYISRGFFYPFLHGVWSAFEAAPDGYDETQTRALLDAYDSAAIPADRQVNVIAIMREAYADFSQYDIEGLDCSSYDFYHALQDESYSGKLVTNIFGGGTVNTERCFLTGNAWLRNFRGNTNSYVWYFRDQGYTTEGSHPYFQWYYNRRNINGYLGFESYRFREGDYEYLCENEMGEDDVLFPEIYSDFVENKSTGKPYFSFSVTVQTHGPYNTSEAAEHSYLTGDYSEACVNAMDHYMELVSNSDVQLAGLVEQLRAESEPVVLVLFADHLPWMGDGSVYYEEMGVNFDMDTEAGFLTYYSTDYLIWANDAAKELLGNDFVGEGPTVSSCYLMNLLFEQCGWDGPDFMQAMDDMREVFPVVTSNGCYVVDGVFTDEIPARRAALFSEFESLQYLWRTQFLF